MIIDPEVEELQEKSVSPEDSGKRKTDEGSWDEVRSGFHRTARLASSLARSSWKSRVSTFNSKRIWPITATVVGLILAGVAGYLVVSRFSAAGARPQATQTAPRPAAQPTAPQGQSESLIAELFGAQAPTQPEESQPWPVVVGRTTLKLAIAALLTAVLAFRPRRDVPLFQRNPYVAQTQILLAVVASALMMIVSDNAARAFGIFAAASLVRFRTNIRDPKEITVLLISLAIGLATGVGRMELALILAVFVFLMLSVLEYFEPEQIFRALELTVSTRRLEETDEVLREIFDKRNITSELRKMDREDPENPLGKIVYFVNVSGDISTDKLSEEIFNADPEHIDSIQWDQKKTSSYVYR